MDADQPRLEISEDEMDDGQELLVVQDIGANGERVDALLSGFYPHPQDVGCFQAPE